ncbi:hypothetical protein B0T16DRAFT_130219 [Cercophora newfieldiana]|uniref:Uncharacterized protein n=1 Tax=Cercophora newfieldiana TaxID=92897 RepID=A0AA39YDC5_9PEZI|nr:hypothetical protein B0T16DRAFT_130219 [Cercophora newfieldiana]
MPNARCKIQWSPQPPAQMRIIHTPHRTRSALLNDTPPSSQPADEPAVAQGHHPMPPPNRPSQTKPHLKLPRGGGLAHRVPTLFHLRYSNPNKPLPAHWTSTKIDWHMTRRQTPARRAAVIGQRAPRIRWRVASVSGSQPIKRGWGSINGTCAKTLG